MNTPIYTTNAIQDWESRWFADGNSSFGLMKQASLRLCLQIIDFINKNDITQTDIIVWCGVGNNGGDGYLTAKYLTNRLDDKHFKVQIIAPNPPKSINAIHAKSLCTNMHICDNVGNITRAFEKVIHLDALFGHGLDRELDKSHQNTIHTFNAQAGTKIALDIPSGLHPNRGMPMPICTKVDMTLCVMGLKMGLFVGVAKDFVGKVINLSLIPPDDELLAVAYLSDKPTIPIRQNTAHKGDFGTVAIVGGHQCMGGAVIMASQMAMSMGAGRVTAVCHATHHGAMLTRSPNVMVADIDKISANDLSEFERVAFGMGLGRDTWAKMIFDKIMDKVIHHAFDKVVLDADALYFLAKNPCKLPNYVICTPHLAEAARLLGVRVADVKNDKLDALYRLYERYGGQWVIKGANTLSFDGKRVQICPFGNAFMASAGMGDVLAGMLIGTQMNVHDVVAWHGIMGDRLADGVMFGIHAYDMADAAGMM